ncbi:MAG: primosomal protein N' [Planctomycetota bacterium]
MSYRNEPSLFRNLEDKIPKVNKTANSAKVSLFVESKSKEYAGIVFSIPIDKVFHYAVPEHLREKVGIGSRVLAPFSKGMLKGYCVSFPDAPEVASVKEIVRVLDNTPLVGRKLLELARWISEYYFCSLGEAIENMLPGAVRKARSKTFKCVETSLTGEALHVKLTELSKKHPKQAEVLEFIAKESGKPVPLTVTRLLHMLRISESPVKSLAKKRLISIVKSEMPLSDIPITKPPVWQEPPIKEYTPEQQKAIELIDTYIEKDAFGVILLYGVSGSGKTEVYIRAIRRVVELGKQAIILVPEVALTPQTVGRFIKHFPKIALLHSYQPPPERNYGWQKVYRGEAQVIIGPRSAVFAPAKNLGLIVIDEEHETSFKQENAPRYHARDVAIMRAQLENFPILLGSATPDLVTLHNAESGKYNMLALPHRVRGATMPVVETVNMLNEQFELKRNVLISRTLLKSLNTVIKRGEQAIFFLNRRGFSTFLMCPRCGFVLMCRDCDITLTYHKRTNRTLCHYCGSWTTPPQACPECFFQNLRYLGAGTEKIEDIITKVFPEVKLERMDSDTMRTKDSYSRVLYSFKRGEIDLLVGTQMVAKGLDFPNVTLVGVIQADNLLSMPDFRSSERTFQLLVQVAGRSGRAEKQGYVIIQTNRPDNYCIKTAAKLDYDSFAKHELSLRKPLRYPPFGRLLKITISSKKEMNAFEKSKLISEALTQTIQSKYSNEKRLPVTILGPAPAPLSRIKGEYRYQILLKADNSKVITEIVSNIRNEIKSTGNTHISVDRDPYSML